jgi:hypothetical protein
VTLDRSGGPRRQDTSRYRDGDIGGLKLAEAVRRRQEVIEALERKTGPEKVEPLIAACGVEEETDPLQLIPARRDDAPA